MEFEKHCWAQIDLDALKENFNTVCKTAHPTPVMAVVKANAYGHGAKTVAALFESLGATWFGVSSLQEAQELRRSGIKGNILILGYTTPQFAKELAENNIVQTVHTLQYAQELADCAIKHGVCIDVHVKIDTGMGRLGFSAVGGSDDLEACACEVAKACSLKGINASGIYTHFAVADSVKDEDVEYTKGQYLLLRRTIDALAAKGKAFGMVHCCNSAGALEWEPFNCDMVRVGIALYGQSPSADNAHEELKSTLQLCTVVSQVKEIKPGTCISYGRTFCAKKPMRVATLSAGYADGYPRLMSSRGTVSINGRPAKIIGRVCMDQIVVDVTDIDNVAQGDTAVLYGDGIADSASRIAQVAGTVNYEILTSVGHRVPRIYLKGEKQVEIADYLAL